LANNLSCLTYDLTGLTHDLACHLLHLANALLGLTNDLSAHLLALPTLLVMLVTVRARRAIAADGPGRAVAPPGPVRTVVRRAAAR
jgi:hypothetical protein